MTKQNKPDEQGDALTPGAIATMRELGWSEARIEAERRNAERIRAAGGFSKYVRKAEAARLFSEAVGFHHEPEHMDLTEYDSRAEGLTAHGPSWDKPRTPEWWADALATETAERQGWAGMRGEEMRLVARANNLRTLEAAADDLPLLQWPNEEAWPKGQPLPDKWRNGLFMRKAGLRTWAKEHAPHWLGSALLAEPAPESAPAVEAATIADGKKRAANEWTNERIEEMRQTFKRFKGQPLCNDFAARTAKQYGISTQRMYVLMGPVPKDIPSAFDVVARSPAKPATRKKRGNYR
ncbi:MAG: hypothetical protein HIU89_10185 [Proteobacteria bacterium]|nr:hypothetical protein [Pseudomonadota bacterium]